MRLTTIFISFLLSLATALTPWNEWSHGRVTLQDVSIHFRYSGTGPPLLLVHGNPQYSLTWQTIGPILAQNYTVIAPDNRGAGDSSIPPNGDYSAESTADDLKGVLDFLGINETYVFSHDKGSGFATALALKYPAAVRMLGLSEYALPGFGYEDAAMPAPFWDLYANPQLAFFQIPDFAEFLISGKEKQFLSWYFYHGSYSGGTSFSEDTLNQYTTSIAKPGFLRAMFGPFSAASVAADHAFFTTSLSAGKMATPILGLGGEASFGIPSILQSVLGNLSTTSEIDVVPKAGHWIADENPVWVANRVGKWLQTDSSPLNNTDLSWFAGEATITIGYFGTYRNADLAGFTAR
ncbi:hypothetical protein PFICI_12376 [Pestalotiopsis fici W106-1]|uniref:AB hydrolase-1 domain-containing protein n=1 Tax=Pestalotiopsis fici (strain W106-1 / CGMCC3.15140) TaxID=1229662 RepID=W3WQL0_PESFW|nr:uncharacterized protein PFICI_12376 [Pestalotiopsis fici W106-1]ETS75432.1 hypothetical protein PFICI_12376 [Pestalotiopsis fici W106-1]